MSFTNYLEHATLDFMFGATAFTPSGTLYVGLSTTTPGEDASSFTEPSSASGYSRASIPNVKASTSGWSSAAQLSTSGEIHNQGIVSFGTASGNWGTITHAGVWNSLTGGNLLTVNALTVQKSPTSGDVISFPSGAISLRLD